MIDIYRKNRIVIFGITIGYTEEYVTTMDGRDVGKIDELKKVKRIVVNSKKA